jgi:hypothetical protein
VRTYKFSMLTRPNAHQTGLLRVLQTAIARLAVGAFDRITRVELRVNTLAHTRREDGVHVVDIEVSWR